MILPESFWLSAGDAISMEFGRTWTDPAFDDPDVWTRPFKASPISTYLNMVYLGP